MRLHFSPESILAWSRELALETVTRALAIRDHGESQSWADLPPAPLRQGTSPRVRRRRFNDTGTLGREGPRYPARGLAARPGKLSFAGAPRIFYFHLYTLWCSASDINEL